VSHTFTVAHAEGARAAVNSPGGSPAAAAAAGAVAAPSAPAASRARRTRGLTPLQIPGTALGLRSSRVPPRAGGCSARARQPPSAGRLVGRVRVLGQVVLRQRHEPGPD